MAVTVTGSPIVAFNTVATVTQNAATSSVIDEVEVFTITPTKADYKGVIEFVNAAGHGAYTFSIPAGDQYGAGEALTGSIAAGETNILEVEAGKYMTDGKYAVTLTPASGKRLLTDHAAFVNLIETL